MHRRPAVIAIVLIFSAGILFCPDVASAQRPTTQQYPFPDTVDGLTDYFKDMLNTAKQRDEQAARKLLIMSQLLVLPKSEEWFTRTFDKDLGLKLNAKYQEEMKNFGPNMAKLFLNLAEPDKLMVTVIKVEASDDPQAKPYQVLALDVMANPVPLYSVVIKKEGTSAAIQIWSIINENGIFRMVGHMDGVYEKTSATKPTTSK